MTNFVVLHVIRREPTPDHGRLTLAMPGPAHGDRVILWEGLAPLPVPEHPNIAPIVLSGDLDGRRAYAERVPNGLRLDEIDLPAEFAELVVVRVLEGLAHLQRHRQVHGTVAADRVIIGPDGTIVLFGRGRRGGIAGLDLVAGVSLLPGPGEETLPGESAELAAQELSRRVPPGAAAALAEWARARIPPPPQPIEQIVLTVGGPAEGTDEVVPDLGPDTGDSGLLDRWSVTTSSGTGETTPAAHGDHDPPTPNLADELWARVALYADRSPPDDRFAAVAGQPSRGLRAVLGDEWPDVLPAPLVGDVARLGPVHRMETGEDMPTVVRNQLAAALGEHTETGVSPLRPVARPRRGRGLELVAAMIVGGLLATILRWLL